MSKKKRLEKNVNGVEKPKDKSVKVPQRDKLEQELSIYHRDDLTEKQKQFLDVILSKKTNIIFLRGNAGTSKTFLAIYAGLMALNSKTQADITYIRAPIEVGKSIGYLPGEFNEKIDNYLIPLYDKLEELLPKSDIDYLLKDQRITGNIPNFVRGQNWNAKYVIIDEAQNIDAGTMKTLISRIGKYSKVIFLADESQTDVRGPVEFMRYFDLFNDESSKELGIHCLSFTRQDIVRSPILGYILDKIEGTYTPPAK